MRYAELNYFKATVLHLLLMGLPLSLLAQDETLINGKIESGGYGALVLKTTQIKDEMGLMVGGSGGWILNHSFVIGGAGYGLVTNVGSNQIVFGNDTFLNMGYGGLWLEYIPEPRKLWHVSFNILVGAGGLNLRSRNFSRNFFEWDSFFVAEPGAVLMLNITHHFRVGLGASYRFVDGVDLGDVSDNDVSGAAANVFFKFGKF
ncbi:MAG: hypothetical protein ACE5HO_07870 [bacterium]